MYKFDKLESYLHKAMRSEHPLLSKLAGEMAANLIHNHQDEDVADGHLEKDLADKQMEEEDKILDPVMPELSRPNPNDTSPFGSCPDKQQQAEQAAPLPQQQVKQATCLSLLMQKQASAYIKDSLIAGLPAEVVADIKKFIPVSKSTRVINYGMVVKELLPKADEHNLDQALSNVRKTFAGKSMKKEREEFFKKAKDKYILILNDKIIDGHHFLAKAKELGITNSLKVLDLTPVRFQEKPASLLTVLKQYGKRNNRRKNTLKA